jgi:hypothetical protein
VQIDILERARLQFLKEDSWWRENRDVKELFAQEFLTAIRQIQDTPTAGRIYATKRGRTIRKWLMPKTRCHVYYRYEPEQDLLVIYSVWGARRRRGPKL